MPGPLLLAPALAGFAGAVVSGLVTFFASRGGLMLAGLGLTFVAVKGFQTVIGFVIQDIQSVADFVNGTGSGSFGAFGATLIKLAAYAGFFDGLNILISGYVASVSLLSMKFVLARLARA